MDNGPDRVIFTHVWVSRYETHRFPQVDSGKRDPQVLGRHKNHIYGQKLYISFGRGIPKVGSLKIIITRTFSWKINSLFFI